MKFNEWLNGIFAGRPKNAGGQDVCCPEFDEAVEELAIRIHAQNVCINFVANLIGRCDFREMRKGIEQRYSDVKYLWQISPNANQSSTEFLHELVYKLYTKNEVLIVEGTVRESGLKNLLIADTWNVDKRVMRENRYSEVAINDLTLKKTFNESDVIHLKLNHRNATESLGALYENYQRVIKAATKMFTSQAEKKWKVHVDQIQSGKVYGPEGNKKEFAEFFAEQMEKTMKPFINAENGVLPEFNGWNYSELSGKEKATTSRDIRALYDDILDFTAQSYGIPTVLVSGKVEATEDAMQRALTNCVDPLMDQLEEQINAKAYGLERWKNGDCIRIDTSTIMHYDLFKQAANVEKLIGSGVFTINDVLRAANQPEISRNWANAHFMTLNISPIEGERSSEK